MTGSCSLGTLDRIRRWQLESLVRELACVPPSAGICYLCTLHGIFLLASATVGRICYLGTLNSICLFSFHSASATVGRICYLGTLNSICLFSFHSASATIGRICYLGTLNSICLFSFHSASATIGRICYLGTPSGICLFSFHFALATIDRITVSRHVRQQLPLWQLESLVHELACAPPSAGICYLGTLNGVCPLCFHFASATVDRICYLGMLNGICLFSLHFAYCIGHRRPDHSI